jgi:hypothetical protein
LEIGSHFLVRSAWTAIFLFYTSHVARMTHHPAFFHWNGTLWTFSCFPWSGTTSSGSQPSHTAWDDRCVPLCPANFLFRLALNHHLPNLRPPK